jgi:hypothetical protein
MFWFCYVDVFDCKRDPFCGNWLAERRVISQEGLAYMELVCQLKSNYFYVQYDIMEMAVLFIFLWKKREYIWIYYQLSDHVRILKQKIYLVHPLLGPRLLKRSSETDSTQSTVVHSGHGEHWVKSNRETLSWAPRGLIPVVSMRHPLADNLGPDFGVQEAVK